MNVSKRMSSYEHYRDLLQIYLQKFLTYEVLTITIFIAFIQFIIVLNNILNYVIQLLKLWILILAFKISLILLMVFLFMILVFLGITAFRTYIESYSLEILIGSIPWIMEYVEKDLISNRKIHGLPALLYKYTTRLYDPRRGRRINVFITSTMIILYLIALTLLIYGVYTTITF
ncbi:MAG: hypothetical protein B6U89_07365 [Desulfurococcales archaeon ex4484_58]|nr:MAG: hypothetical protein B6U89_07365 [Desulfurococcales archaeon ex4484_58]